MASIRLIFLFVSDIWLAVSSSEGANDAVISRECVEIASQCQRGALPFRPIVPVDRVLDPRRADDTFSQVLRYRHRIGGLVQSPIRVDEDFLHHLQILHNNDDQLRVLLTLLKGDASPDWIRFLTGYSNCGDHSLIFTCINDTCREYDLRRLKYVPTIFTEDVLGLDLKLPFSLSLLIMLKNRATDTRRVVRVRVDHVALFDTIFNVVKGYFGSADLSEAPLIAKLDEYRSLLAPPHRATEINILRRSKPSSQRNL